MLDYEGEFGVIIGRRCSRVPKERAAEVIAGYTIVNDVSVRDWQLRVPTMTMGKSWDTHCPMVPYLVRLDEIDDPEALCDDARRYAHKQGLELVVITCVSADHEWCLRLTSRHQGLRKPTDSVPLPSSTSSLRMRPIAALGARPAILPPCWIRRRSKQSGGSL